MLVTAQIARFVNGLSSKKSLHHSSEFGRTLVVGRETEDVGVIVFATDFGDLRVITNDGADALEAIGLHANTVGRATN